MSITLGDILIYFRGKTEPLEQAMQQTEDRARSWAASVGGIMQGAFSFFVGDMLTNGLNNLVQGFQQSAIGMNASLETTTLQFKTLMGDMDAAREHVAMLFDFAKNTPFETGPIIAASLKLQTFGGNALNTAENITRMGNAAAATSAPLDALGFWMGRLYSSVQGGRPFGEASAELQNLAVISDDTRTKMEDLQKSGASADEVWKVFTDHLDTFNGAMAEQAQTWNGLTSTLMDTVSMLGADIFAPFFDLAKDGLSSLNDYLAGADFESWKNSIVSAMSDAATWIRDVASAAIPMLIRAWEVLGPAVQAVGSILEGVGTIISNVAAIAYNWGSDLVAQYANGIYSGVGWVVEALQYIADVVTSWLEPHSPPKILPNIDVWGDQLVKMYMSGWSDPSLFSSLQDFGKTASSILQNMFARGELGNASVPELLLGTQGAMADALNELNETGDVSEEAFGRIREAAGAAGAEVEALARAYVTTATATRRMADAQQELNDLQSQAAEAADAVAMAAAKGDAAGLAAARSAQEEIRQRRGQAQVRRDQAAQEQREAQAKIQREQQLASFQREQIDLLRQLVQEQEKANAAAAKKPKGKKGETEEERNARLAKEAQEAYEYSLMSTAEKLDYLRAKQSALNPGQAEYWRLAGQIKSLEDQAAREAKKNADDAEREAEKQQRAQEALKQAQWDHAYAIADTATKLQMMKDKLATLNPEQQEYYRTLTQIDQLEKQLAREREAEAKRGAKGGGGGGKGRGGAGGPKAPTAPKPPTLRRPTGPSAADGAEERDNAPMFEGLQTRIADSIKKVADAFQALVPVNTIISTFNSSLGVLGQTITQTIIPSFQKLGPAIMLGLGNFSTLGPQVSAALNAIVPIIGLVINEFTKLTGLLISSVVSALAGAVPGAMFALSSAFSVVLGIVKFVGDSFTGFVNIIKALFTGDLVQIGDAFNSYWSNLFKDILQIVGGAVAAIAGLIGALVAGVIAFFQNLYTVLVGASIIPDMVNGIITWITTLVTSFGTMISTLVTDAITQFTGLVQPVIDQILAVKDGILEKVDQLARDWGSKLVAITGDVQKWLTELGPKSAAWASTAGGSLIQGLWDGISKKWDEFWKWWSGKLQALRDSLPFSEPRDPRSPLRGLTNSGRAIVEMLQTGMASAGPLEVPQLTMNNQILGGSAGAGAGGDMHFHAPLIGQATIRSDQDIVDLAYQVAKVIKKKAGV